MAKKKQKMVTEAEAQRREEAQFFRGHKAGCQYTLENIHNALGLYTTFERKK